MLARVSRLRYEVYPGVFRGAAATLGDSAGNDYDRALLLHDLLLAADPSARMRYAFCTLSPNESASAVAAARTAYVAPRIAATAEMLAQRTTNATLRDRYLKTAAFWRAATLQARDQTTQLGDDFRKAGATLIPADGHDLADIASHHVWVEVQSQGAWLDPNPSVPQPAPGKTTCTAASTSDALPALAYDTVTAALRLESRDGTQVKDALVASGTWRTSDLAYASLVFAFAEPSELHPPAPQPEGMLAFTPVIVAGQQTTVAVPIVIPKPVKGPGAEASTKGASKVLDAFSTADTPAPPAPPKPAAVAAPVPVALRLDVSVSAPDAAARTVERPIFDRVSAADRAAGRAATATLADLSMYAFGTVWSVGVNLGTAVVGTGDRAKLDMRSNEPAAIVRAMGRAHRSYYLLRRAAFADIVGSSAPPVASSRAGISFLGLARYAAGPVPFGLTMDRAVEGGGPHGGDGASSLAWGVSSVYGERLAVAMPAMMKSVEKLDQLPFDDTIEMFYIARHSNNPPALVRSGSEVANLKASADAKARLNASLSGGASAVVPSAPVGYGGSNDHGWWILAPEGAVTDEMQSGMHQTLIERAEIAWEDLKASIQIRKEGAIIKCAAVAAAGLMGIAAAGGGEGAAEIVEQEAELIHAIYEADEQEEIMELATECEL